MSRTELSLSDEWETPKKLYDHLWRKYKLKPRLDVACQCDVDIGKHNSKCYEGWFKNHNALTHDWIADEGKVDVWCNPPHSKNEEFVKKAHNEWAKHNINIMMILPANALCTNYAENWIDPFAEYHPINRKFCKFLYKGEKKDSSRNGYFVVIWRKIWKNSGWEKQGRTQLETLETPQ